MRVTRLKMQVDALGGPDDSAWRNVPGDSAVLVPTPAGLQPTGYAVARAENMTYGATRRIAVKAAHDGTQIAFRLEWLDPAPNERRLDNGDFADAVAMLFPLNENAPLMMGAPEAPVELWYWRADRPAHARSDTATGIGTSKIIDANAIAASAVRRDGRWTVVLRRALRTKRPASESVQITPGAVVRVAFAVWDGGNRERAGIKAFSPGWLQLTIEG